MPFLIALTLVIWQRLHMKFALHSMNRRPSSSLVRGLCLQVFSATYPTGRHSPDSVHPKSSIGAHLTRFFFCSFVVIVATWRLSDITQVCKQLFPLDAPPRFSLYGQQGESPASYTSAQVADLFFLAKFCPENSKSADTSLSQAE